MGTAWLEVAGLAVEAQTQDYSVDFQQGRINANFLATTEELNALALGVNYQVKQGYKDSTIIGGVPQTETMTPKDLASRYGYKIVGTRYAWKVTDTNSNHGEEIEVVSKISKSNQIVLLDSGKIQVSRNLINVPVRIALDIIYEKVVINDVSSFNKPLVFHALEEDKLYSIPCKNFSRPKNLQSNYRYFEFTFDPSNYKCQTLSD